MSLNNQSVAITDYFRQEKNNRYFEIKYERRKLKREYIYERGTESYDDVITIQIGDGVHYGIGECSPFPSFFEWPIEKVLNDLKSCTEHILAGISFDSLDTELSSPARSGIDLAFIDLKCQQTKKSIIDLYGLPLPKEVTISHTVEYESLSKLGHQLRDVSNLPFLKVKLGSDGLDEERLALVCQRAPNASIVVDVNEGWTLSHLKKIMPVLLKYRVKMIEQPLRHGEDDGLEDYNSPIPIYADESFKSLDDLTVLASRYDGFNIKLDKIGGFNQAFRAVNLCQKMGKQIMVGCLGGTSLLSTAGFIVAQFANFIDLDNHLWLEEDRKPSLGGEDGLIHVPQNWLWGMPRHAGNICP